MPLWKTSRNQRSAETSSQSMPAASPPIKESGTFSLAGGRSVAGRSPLQERRNRIRAELEDDEESEVEGDEEESQNRIKVHCLQRKSRRRPSLCSGEEEEIDENDPFSRRQRRGRKRILSTSGVESAKAKRPRTREMLSSPPRPYATATGVGNSLSPVVVLRRVKSPKPQRKATSSLLRNLSIDMVAASHCPRSPKRIGMLPKRIDASIQSGPRRKKMKKERSSTSSDRTEDFEESGYEKYVARKKTGGGRKRTDSRSRKPSTSSIEDLSGEEDEDAWQATVSSPSSDSSDASFSPLRSRRRMKSAPPKAMRKMTPNFPTRSVPLPDVDASSQPLHEAQLRLHVAAVPDSLPCREEEFAEVYGFVESKIRDGAGGCMYISGLPGTGKTATVKEVLRSLDQVADSLPPFRVVEINGMRLTEPNQAYVQIWQGLSGGGGGGGGRNVTAEHAKDLLAERFTSASSPVVVVLLVDELDMLWSKKQSVLYNLFEWPTGKRSKLVVLAVANTMDLPERVMLNRVSSRLGLTRLTFSPYNHEQLGEIVAARLRGLSAFDDDAVRLVARKVSSLSGDARRALDICRRAAELAGRESSRGTVVGMSHVTRAHEEMFCSPKMMAIRSCCPFEKMLLRTLVAVFAKTGIEETELGRAHRLMQEFSAVEGWEPVSLTVAHSVLVSLVATRLVLAEPGKSGRLDMKIRLNVSTDDVNFALKEVF